VTGAPVRSQSTTHPRLVTKVDSSSGSEVAARQGLAELAACEKNRCILVMLRCVASPVIEPCYVSWQRQF
jgi:hypothetical protein